uniref:Disease resistance protein RPM1 n=1 Tax=Triticum urartu TaxID=4572 RepID=A0A8R7V9P1_TRIUA
MKLLQMSYAALSLPLKSCLLYLSVFREDYAIKKDPLIRVWIAEGFIPRKDTEGRGQQTREESISLWETGERYFNELIMRRLIQPVFNYNDDQAVGCTVHGLILHFIKSSQGKFVTFGADLSSGLFPGSMHTVRRLSLDRYDDQDQDVTLASAAVHLWKVRSITVLGGIEGVASTRPALTVSGKIEGTSLLPSFKLIRVLDLEDSDSLRSRHLKGIQGLVLLRHLGVAGTAIDKLPEEIGELGQLETLDLRRTTKLSILPASIAKQKMLAHLLIDGHVKVPEKNPENAGI